MSTACESEVIFETRDLLPVRDALRARIRERRTCIRSSLQVLETNLAEALAEASSLTVQLFLDINERRPGSVQALRALSRDLGLSPFTVKTGVDVELSHALRLHLEQQARRLAALVQTLSAVESQLAGSDCPAQAASH